MDPRELLGMIAFFSEALNGDELFMLAQGAKRFTYAPGDVVMREDDAGSSIIVVESGSLRVTTAGDSEPLSDLYAGDFIGEMSLLTGARRNATVTAIEPVVAWQIDNHALATVLAESPVLAERLADTMLKRQEQVAHLYGDPMSGSEVMGRAELLSKIRQFYSAG